MGAEAGAGASAGVGLGVDVNVGVGVGSHLLSRTLALHHGDPTDRLTDRRMRVYIHL